MINKKSGIRIAHLSDVHIRLKERHDEYKEVFDRLYKELEKQKPDRILLVGDIVHSKITLSPELVSLATTFFYTLQTIAPVDMIVGNHDMNMSNTDRMDALTPIVKSVNAACVLPSDHGINYMTETGVHFIDEDDGNKIAYGAYSLLDGKDIHLHKKDKEDEFIYIALFHGPVSGCKLDNDYVMSEASTSVTTFNNYDFVMLGDIHKRQFLNDKKNIAYPGSLIQQNHGETIEKGFLMWDIRSAKDFDVEFVRVYNDYAYTTIYADDGVLPDLDLPSKTRIRVVWGMKAKDISRAEASRLNSLIHEKYNPYSVHLTFKPIGLTGFGDIDVDESQNLADPDVQADLLKQWFLNLDDDVDIDGLMKIDKQVNGVVINDNFENFSNSEWSIKKVTMKNFMSYAGETVIDFDKMRGVVGLFGDNAVGKSVIIDAILYALFNKTTREVKNEDLVNKYTDDEVCRVKMHMEIRGVEYLIDRWTTRQYQKRSGRFINARTDVTFNRRYNEDDEWENLTETTRNESEKLIRNAIGSFDDFMITTLSTQGGSSEFLSLKSSPRSDAMLRFLGLDVFTKKYDYANDILKQIESERRGYDKENNVDLLDTKKNQLAKKTTEESKIERLISKSDDEIDAMRKQVSDHKRLINQTIKIDKDESTLQEESNVTAAEAEDIELKIEDLHDCMSSLVSKMEEIESGFILDENKLLVYSAIRETCARRKRKIEKNEAEITSHKRVLSVYRSDLRHENKCPTADDSRHVTCLFLRGYTTKKEKCIELLDVVNELQLDNESLQRFIDKDLHCYDILNEQEKIREYVEKAVIKLHGYKKQLSDYENRFGVLEVSLALINSQLKLAIANKQTIKNNRTHNSEIKRLEAEIKKMSKTRSTNHDLREGLSKKVIILEKEIGDIEDTLQKIRESDTQHRLFNIYCNAMHIKGLPVDVLKNYIPKINYEINKILSDVVDYGVYMKIDEGETDIDIVMRYDGEGDDTRPAQMSSGKEKFMINMAIRYSLLTVSNLNTPSTWFIDEGFGTLDAESKSSMFQFFSNVKSIFRNVVIITHIDELKDVADHVINIEKKNGISAMSQPVINS